MMVANIVTNSSWSLKLLIACCRHNKAALPRDVLDDEPATQTAIEDNLISESLNGITADSTILSHI